MNRFFFFLSFFKVDLFFVSFESVAADVLDTSSEWRYLKQASVDKKTKQREKFNPMKYRPSLLTFFSFSALKIEGRKKASPPYRPSPTAAAAWIPRR